MGHPAVVHGVPQRPRGVFNLQLEICARDGNDFDRFLELLMQLADVLVDLPFMQDVVVHFGERRVPGRDASQRNNEFQEVGVGLLPERFRRAAKQIVEERGDGIRDRVRVEIVVQRVVADVGV